jgi:hypothetical protein
MTISMTPKEAKAWFGKLHQIYLLKLVHAVLIGSIPTSVLTIKMIQPNRLE